MGEVTFILSYFIFTFLNKFHYYKHELIDYIYYLQFDFCPSLCFYQKLDRQCGAFELIRESLSASQKQIAPEVLYVEYTSSEESAYEDEEEPITGEVTQKLKGYLTKKLSWERTALTNFLKKQA